MAKSMIYTTSLFCDLIIYLSIYVFEAETVLHDKLLMFLWFPVTRASESTSTYFLLKAFRGTVR